ncbi:hypothetical protein ADL05_22795 [Nocardiopsis sp. NRRL B-16309]|nr:hypothetical protein ADL05_22795 [Nocardiopsis sp. NRRL B-16309]
MLLQYFPVVRRYDEDEISGTSEYDRFLYSHMVSRDDGRWLADRRDAAPANAVLRPVSSPYQRAADYDPSWKYQITVDMFLEELFPSPEQITVWSFRQVQDSTRSETVSVHTALVAPGTAPALLRALQSAPDKHAYRIPDANDEEYCSTIPGFELTGWIESHGHRYGCDHRDPYAAGVEFPPTRPAVSLEGLDGIEPDVDLRVWRNNDEVVALSHVWDERGDGNQATGTFGESLIVDRTWLTSLLTRLDRWLIVEVEIERRLESTTARHIPDELDGDEDDRFRFLYPYTKYFLIDTAGVNHDL